MNWRGWLPQKSLPTWQSLIAGLALGAAGAAVRLALPRSVGHDAPFVVFFPFVALATAVGGVAGGLASLLLATLAAVRFRENLDAAFAGPLAAFWVAGGLIIVLTSALGALVRELRAKQAVLAEAKDQLQTVAGELAHRNRNSLFVIMSIVSQSARDAGSASEAARIINGRLEALLRAQELLVQSDTGAVDLAALLKTALEPFGLERFELAPSPDVLMATDVGMGLGLIFHELATNAVKHGALSTPGGRIRVGWTMAGQMAQLTWRETGGPAVQAPSRQGFGSRLLQVALVPQGGKAERRFDRDGLVCELMIPAPPNPPRFLASVPAGAAFALAAQEPGEGGASVAAHSPA